MAALRLILVASTFMVVSLTESAVIAVGGEKGCMTGFDYGAWATAQNLQLRVDDSLLFFNLKQVYHSADVYQSCTLGAGGGTIHLIPTNYTMTIPASLESTALYAVFTVPGHCMEGQNMKAAVLPALNAATVPSAIVSNPNDADLNRYICWTTAVLLITACFWNSS